MIYKFKGKTEKDAVNKAQEALNRTDFDVEIISQTKGFFKKSEVEIKVYLRDEKTPTTTTTGKVDISKAENFLMDLFNKMGYEVKINVSHVEDDKIYVNLESENSSVLIGKRGKTLESLQNILNIFVSKNYENYKIILDCEDYRSKGEDFIIRNAFRSAKKVLRTKKSILLDPLNPYERRLVHKALSEVQGIQTVSEGDGLYKQIRIIFEK